jgi:hypothetical protein
MPAVTQDYINSLDPIYRDILAAFPRLEPGRKAGYGLAYGTLFEGLQSRYSLGLIAEACQEMEKGGAVTIKNGFFVHPTALGEEIIAATTGVKPAEESIRPFSPPTQRQ